MLLKLQNKWLSAETFIDAFKVAGYFSRNVKGITLQIFYSAMARSEKWGIGMHCYDAHAKCLVCNLQKMHFYMISDKQVPYPAVIDNAWYEEVCQNEYGNKGWS